MIQSNLIKVNYIAVRKQILLLFVVGVAINLVIFSSVWKHGLGISTDGVEYLFTGQNVAAGEGFLSYHGGLFSAWPPLYPLSLAFLRLIIPEAEMLSLALLLNFLTALALAFVTAVLMVRIFPNRRILAVWGYIFVICSALYINLFHNVNSDFLFWCFTIAFFLDAATYIRTCSQSSFIRMWMWGSLSALERYIGVTVIICAVLVVIVYTPGKFWRKTAVAAIQSLALIPMLIWNLRNLSHGLASFGLRTPAHNTLSEKIVLSFQTIVNWFIPENVYPGVTRWATFLVIAAWLVFLIIFAVVPQRRKYLFYPETIPIFGFSVIYVTFFLISASQFQFLVIPDRYLVPLYIPIVVAALLAIDMAFGILSNKFNQSASSRTVAILMFGIIPFIGLALVIPDSFQILRDTAREGVTNADNLYNRREWEENEAIEYLKSHPLADDSVIFANIPAGVAFQLGRTVKHSPRAYERVNPRWKYDLSEFIDDLTPLGKQVYFIWIATKEYEHVYHPKQLRRFVELKQLYQAKDGSLVLIVNNPNSGSNLQPIPGVANQLLLEPIWQPTPGMTWQWQLTDEVDTDVDAQVFDIDLFDSEPELLFKLKSSGIRVICYISVGSWEEWRPDADKFPDQVIGAEYESWEGERWLDIRQIDLLAPVLQKRLDLCREKGFDAVEPDNIDGYLNETGFPLTYKDQLSFNMWLADEVHQRGLGIGLKNDPDQVEELLPFYDFALTEDCFAENWCEQVIPFINAGKAVFSAEYTDKDIELDDLCDQSRLLGFSAILKKRNLDAWRKACP